MERESIGKEKWNLTEERKYYNDFFISNTVNYNLQTHTHTHNIEFSFWYTFITVNRNYTSEWNDY